MRRIVFTPRLALVSAALAASLALPLGAAQAAPTEAQLAEGKALFQKDAKPMACAVCHTMKDAGTTGSLGPDLDELQPSQDQILAVLRDGSGPMPSFADTLSESQREAVAAYVVWATQPH